MQAIVNRAAHDGFQDIAVIGLGQVIISAGLEAFDHVLVFGFRGLHHNRNMLHHFVFLDVGEQLHTVECRHHAVENYGIEAFGTGFEQAPGFLPVVGGDQFIIIVFQVRADNIEVDWLVVNYQYRRFRIIQS